MPNLILTGNCNNNCTYCFTTGDALGDLSLRALQGISPFLSSFQNKTLNVLGGEPSRNPEFIPILQYLLRKEYELRIFTSGDIPHSVLEQLRGLTEGSLEFIVNRTSEALTANTVRFYKALGHRIKIGLTFFRSGQLVRHVIKEIEDYRLRKAIRIGIALPSSYPLSNTYLSPEAYPRVSDEMFPFILDCMRQGITPEFDCGFPYCFFTDEQRAILRDHAVDFSSNCGPIPDILPDQTVIPCFPLAGLSVGISQTSSWLNARNAMEESIAAMDGKNLYEKCSGCEYVGSHQCSKGCAALRAQYASSSRESGSVVKPAFC